MFNSRLSLWINKLSSLVLSYPIIKYIIQIELSELTLEPGYQSGTRWERYSQLYN